MQDPHLMIIALNFHEVVSNMLLQFLQHFVTPWHDRTQNALDGANNRERKTTENVFTCPGFLIRQHRPGQKFA